MSGEQEEISRISISRRNEAWVLEHIERDVEDILCAFLIGKRGRAMGAWFISLSRAVLAQETIDSIFPGLTYTELAKRGNFAAYIESLRAPYEPEGDEEGGYEEET